MNATEPAGTTAPSLGRDLVAAATISAGTAAYSFSKRLRLSAAVLSVLSMFSCSYGDREDKDEDNRHKRVEVILSRLGVMQLPVLAISGTMIGELRTEVILASPMTELSHHDPRIVVSMM